MLIRKEYLGVAQLCCAQSVSPSWSNKQSARVVSYPAQVLAAELAKTMYYVQHITFVFTFSWTLRPIHQKTKKF